MSHNPGDAATTAREQKTEQTSAPSAEENAQGAQPATSDQPTGAQHQAEHAHATGTQPSENAPDTEAGGQTSAGRAVI
jgi:hypothetical protein